MSQNYMAMLYALGGVSFQGLHLMLLQESKIDACWTSSVAEVYDVIVLNDTKAFFCIGPLVLRCRTRSLSFTCLVTSARVLQRHVLLGLEPFLQDHFHFFFFLEPFPQDHFHFFFFSCPGSLRQSLRSS